MKILKMVKSKILVLGLIFTMLGTSSIPALAEELPAASSSKEVTISSSLVVTPLGAIYYEKTVPRTYSSVSQIPEYIPYSEYNNELGSTFSGRLYLVSVTVSGGNYNAIFTGILSGSGL